MAWPHSQRVRAPRRRIRLSPESTPRPVRQLCRLGHRLVPARPSAAELDPAPVREALPRGPLGRRLRARLPRAARREGTALGIDDHPAQGHLGGRLPGLAGASDRRSLRLHLGRRCLPRRRPRSRVELPARRDRHPGERPDALPGPGHQHRQRLRVHGRVRDHLPDASIPLFLLPPRSPKLHAGVERANRTHTEEFHEVTDAEPDLAPLAPALRVWEATYNRVRPHQSLGYLTPAEYLASLGIDV